MCGIAGTLRFDGAAPDMDAVRRMVEALRPRGPDDEGLHRGATFGLGHRRLAVIDPTPRSAQPMHDAALGLTIVYNGALYEYRALRRRLEHRGYRFSSEGDTEVVLKAFHAWGVDCVEHLAGMFAFAIVDTHGRTFLARDRMGIKPLLWSEHLGGMHFASTLPALLKAGALDTAIDPVALHHYMSLHGIVAAPRTILSGARKLPPGTWMLIEADGRRRTQTYWSLPSQPEPVSTPEAWADQLEAALDQAIRRRCVADTEVGVLLSGGLDSSLIVAMLSAHQAPVSTFSVGFAGEGGERGDEFEFSDAVAQRYGTEHTQIQLSHDQTLAALPEAIAAMSEPMMSHDCVGFLALGQRVGQTHKVVQCGQGADELLGGYHWYDALRGATQPDAYAQAFVDRQHADYMALVEPAWAGADHTRALIAAHFASSPTATVLQSAMRLDTAVMLPSDPITRLDSMMMASGIEARVPFLDEDVVAVASRIPAEVHAAGGKAILKAVARRYLPAPLVDRPKGYFPVPALRWIRGAFAQEIRRWLLSPRAQQRGLFRRDAVERLLGAPSPSLSPLGGSTLWQIAVLEQWLSTHGL